MGITWRFAMTLLSTLAALVIIVHSAEENLERDSRERRYDLRPRLLDTRPLDEQPWRVVRPEPIMQHSAQGEVWHNDSQDEPPVRRKLGRKRKRRPPASLEDEQTEKQLTLPSEEHEEVNDQDPETGRRRQKLRPNQWTEGTIDPDRPLRKRGQRRKRPSLGNWPRLSEFGDHHRDVVEIVHTSDEADGKGHGYYSRKRIEDDYDEHVRTKIRHPDSDDYEPKERTKIRRPGSNSRYVIAQETGNEEEKPERERLVKEDKSLSEFSMELMGPLEPTEDDQIDIDDKLREKSPRIFFDMDKAQEPGTIDPITLKEILKRSNGTSLSEILQQHNLTLADLLNGKENAISVLKSFDDNHSSTKENNVDRVVNDNANSTELERSQRELIINDNLNFDSDINLDKDHNITNQNTTNNEEVEVKVVSEQSNKENNAPIPHTIKNKYNVSFTAINKNAEQRSVALENRNSGSMIKRRFPPGIRRKLRMRPMANNTFKSQINRDLIALSARRYIHHNRRNATKSKEWRDMIPLIMTVNTTENQKKKEENNSLTTNSILEETTTVADLDETIETTIANEVSTGNHFDNSEDDGMNTEIPEPSTISIEILATEMDASITERPTTSRPSNAAGLRRQAFNNRLKKKRLKQRTSTTETPSNDIMKNLLELGDLVSSSEFIARTQIPKVTVPNDFTETVTELEDFLTTETTSRHTSIKSTKTPTTREFTKSSAATQTPLIFSTEETSKIEIEEILNDTHTSTKLSKILKERNMTLSELLQHRERGSSHVHLADIFHNASREPNPPEPFLSKSLLEPISKETYPLRAILEANAHEQATKPTTIDPIYTNHVNIPVIMDFGNNVNENAENMGIMSLFNNYTKEATLPSIEKSTLQQDSKGTPYKSTIIAVNATDDGDINRESRMLNDDQDMISWNEIFSMIRKNQKNETKALEKLTNELPPPGTYKKIVLEEDVDGDGLIVLEDLQNLKSTEKKVATVSEEKIEFNSYEGADETSQEPGILKNAPSSAKSVTVATASIVGLGMILFLLTYAALKWKQQRSVSHKKTFGDDRIPTPVFENRKVKKNCSSRSISPMLPTSNIYTMNTLESQTGKDSPEYMWDTLRKPFQ